ncbi:MULTISPECIES: SCO family protein [unclassified Cupriavidus]|uniref:SCO family protein n=2 Tax=Cupriavidus TaxID=106589 RepID=UPI001BFFF90A|nr:MULTISPECIES: SCO family protein [unclassified Cupriavidus]MCA3184225.1 SCO family protein [Cupriavidus sp.]MCA3193464.1 SCO family protein [Cupriavidus sp.]MCA3199627.1 SCO family protein [Cupriavidus sp.]MCA3235320.1 SCO family protein [Cupriavidus sp.]QWE96125.1 SCO family protein [Cupriavidus sp. EM10]
MSWTRRAWMRALSASVVATASRGAVAHVSAGAVEPLVPAPDAWVVDAAGQRQRLDALMQGKVTALQTMFTGCSSVCPLQGAMFGAVQSGLAGKKGRYPLQLLSLSIDPLGDSPQAMQAWLKKMGAGRTWQGVIPSGDVMALRSKLAGRPPSENLDKHATQVYFFNASAQMCWRSQALPQPEDVVAVMAFLARV